MKRWIEHPQSLKKVGKGIRKSADAVSRKVHNHPLYEYLQSCIGTKKMYWLKMGGVFFLPLLILAHCGQSENKNKKNSKIAVPVMTATVRKGDASLYLNAIGTVTPIESVTIKSQINGKILKVHFDEGQLVTKGQVLVDIDPLPYEALLKQYEGQLLKDQALLKNARLDLKRYKTLYIQDSVAQQTLDTQKYLVEQYEGTVDSDQGLINGVKVNLQYCRITTDISGMVGLRQVNAGNFVQTTDSTPITTVNQISPITVVFPIPEDDLRQVQKKIKNKIMLVADAFDRKEENILATGHLLAIDSQIDNTTGTIKLKAHFDNKDYQLFPNQFVNIRLKVDTLTNTLIIPTAAIQIGREGPFVYIVNDKDKSVSVKAVTIKTTVGGESAVAGDIAEGLLVVVQGTDKLSEGSLVTLTQAKGQETTERPAV